MLKVLIVEDDELCMWALKSLLTEHEVTWAESALLAQKYLKENKYDWALVDLDLEERGAGFQVVAAAVKLRIPTTIVSGHRTEGALLKASQLGARDMLSKPFDPREFKELLASVTQENQNNCELKNYLHLASNHTDLRSLTSCFLRQAPIMLTGESGTGKTRLAKMIHEKFLGPDKPFIHLNCAELSESLAESILFGHVKGSFSGAVENRTGLIEAARGGTLFLDEVATLSAGLQAKLLRVIEEQKVRPVGANFEKHISFNIISATCEDFEQIGFRQDLLYRLSQERVHLRALRDCPQLLLKICDSYLSQCSRRVVLSEGAKTQLQKYPFNGNARDLIAGLERLLQLRKIMIEATDVEKVFGPISERDEKLCFREQVLKFERQIIAETFKKCGENVRQTMQELGITSSTFYRVMKVPSPVQ